MDGYVESNVLVDEDVINAIKSGTQANPYVIPYDGFIYMQVSDYRSDSVRIVFNGVTYKFTDGSNIGDGLWTFPVIKGDEMYVTANSVDLTIATARWYKYREL